MKRSSSQHLVREIGDALGRVGLRDIFEVDARVTVLGRTRVKLTTRRLSFPLPGGGVWFAHCCWQGQGEDALARLARLRDEAGWAEFWQAFDDWHPEATYWPEGWREALNGGGADS